MLNYDRREIERLKKRLESQKVYYNQEVCNIISRIEKKIEDERIKWLMKND